MRFLKKDNHVYHGLAGQFFQCEVWPDLKVRIVAGMQERIAAEGERAHNAPDQTDLQLKVDGEERWE